MLTPILYVMKWKWQQGSSFWLWEKGIWAVFLANYKLEEGCEMLKALLQQFCHQKHTEKFWFLWYHLLACSFKIFINVFAFLYVKVNSKEIYEGKSFPSFFIKMLMSVFLLRQKADYLQKMGGYPSFPLWTPIALEKIYIFLVVLAWCKNPLYLVGTVLKFKSK